MRALLCVALIACGSKTSGPLTPVLPGDDKPPVDAPAAKPAPEIEDWAATVVLPGDLVDLVVHFTHGEGDAWSATLDLPASKVTGFALADITYNAETIRFTIAKPDPSTNEIYAFKRDGTTASGKALIGGQVFFTKMVRLAKGQAPTSVIARPQTPKPPFPYTTRDVEIDAGKDAKLAGTLTIPEGKGPFGAVLLISGSGQQDRDESIFGHKPFALLADRFARAGIATLRTDDRGIGKTVGAIGSLDTDIADAKAAFDWLVKQPEIDPKHAGILGHSVGGTIAPVVATRSKVAFIVGLAAPGVSGADLVPMQIELDLKARKLPDPLVKVIVEGQRKVGKAIAAGKEADIKAALRQMNLDAAAAMGAPKPSDAELDAAIVPQLAQATNPWTVSFFKLDPVTYWQKLKIPVLLVNGDKDTQVIADANLDRIAAALKRAGNTRWKVEKRPGLNHLSQHATTGAVDEYGELEETFDQDTLELIAKWVVETTRRY